MQDFGYDYDLAGNILSIRDRTRGSGILNNPDATTASDSTLAQELASGDALVRRFSYDPLYRLLSATGRECDVPPDGPPWLDVPRCTDVTKTRAYIESYVYDQMGSMLTLHHRNGTGGDVRNFAIESDSNRLRSLQIGQTTFAYAFDVNGNMLSEATSRHFDWNHADQMKTFRVQTDGAEPSVYAQYFYDSSGQRVKKLIRKQGGQVEVTHYVDGGFEHHRWGNGAPASENNTVHVMDDKQRTALIRVGPAQPGDTGPAVQFQLADSLGSSNVVVDSTATFINREEFLPYGETSFGSFARKRYRFVGKERDEESALNYYGARYFAPWILRWTSADPVGLMPELNHSQDSGQKIYVTKQRVNSSYQDRVPPTTGLYVFTLNNPLRYVDPDGKEPESHADLKSVHDFSFWGVDLAVVDKPIENIEGGEEIGKMRALGVEVKAGTGVSAQVYLLKVEAHSDHIFAEQTAGAAGAEASLSKKGLGLEAEAVLVEGKVGGKTEVAGGQFKGSFVVGVTIGGEVKIGPGHFKVQGKAVIGFELEFGQEEVKPTIPPTPEISMEEEVAMRSSSVTHETIPPPLKHVHHRRPARPEQKINLQGCLYGRVGPFGRFEPGANWGEKNSYEVPQYQTR